ncbi:hypothetical protein SFR_6963 (plasmid) [Streptomyces sp. FR-008]|nr:hypothetical protein SFR_6963 [Streptomyces sp. FR-008]
MGVGMSGTHLPSARGGEEPKSPASGGRMRS